MTFATARPLAAGERVVVTLPDRYLLLVSLLVYGLPLAGLLGGAVAGLAALGSDLGAAAGAAAGAASVLLAAPALRARFERATLRRMQLLPGADAHTHSL
jgi:sigma-E factor negative regulatory protein RseC